MTNKQYLICDDTTIPIVVPKRMMVFAGHPDDELISCGGTLLKYQELGAEIFIVVATGGLGGYTKENQKNKIIKTREIELSHMTDELKWNVIELKYSDLRVGREKVARITNLIRDYRPHVILIPHYTDFHRVHRNLSLITREAIYHCATGKAYGGHERNWTPLGVYYYESPSCKFDYIEGNVFIIVDIEKQWEKKKEIFNYVYVSQKEVLERVMDWAEDTATIRGHEIDSRYGEGFIPETTYTPLKILLA
jgi:LmbE family N-acetylglucosaminyl deacetylase